jgi:hypothetical protein
VITCQYNNTLNLALFRVSISLATAFVIILPAFADNERPRKGKTDQALELLRIDAHNHILPYVGRGETNFMGGAMAALKVMEEYGIKKMILMPHPFTSSQFDSYTYVPLKSVVEEYPDRFLFLGGGGTLNVMLHDAARGDVSPELKKKFEQTAEKILSDGAIGFGEIVAEHFSLRSNHPYESVSPDHSLLLLLSDIAARKNVPIDLHMEAIPVEMSRPVGIPEANNPSTLSPNIKKFERLLSHNRKTSIIWAHAGWDNTGYRTTGLMRELLARHPNLSMSIKIRKKQGGGHNLPLKNGEITPDWLALLEEFPDRFMVGSDQFYQPPQAKNPPKLDMEGSERLVRSLPPKLARRVGYENAAKVFKIDP